MPPPAVLDAATGRAGYGLAPSGSTVGHTPVLASRGVPKRPGKNLPFSKQSAGTSVHDQPIYVVIPLRDDRCPSVLDVIGLGFTVERRRPTPPGPDRVVPPRSPPRRGGTTFFSPSPSLIVENFWPRGPAKQPRTKRCLGGRRRLPWRAGSCRCRIWETGCRRGNRSHRGRWRSPFWSRSARRRPR
jgi:hypothetical protein